MKTLPIIDLELITGGASPRPTVQNCRANDVLAGKTSAYAKADPTELVSPGEWRRLSQNSTAAADSCWAKLLRRR